MKMSLVFINSFILGMIALLHFYWAFGGKKWLIYAIPTNPESSLNFKPGFFPTFIVGLGLLGFSLTLLSNFSAYQNASYPSIFTRTIGVIFLIRAIGDFNYVGIKKKVKNTIFAKKDSQLFVPLCFWLGLSSILISLLP